MMIFYQRMADYCCNWRDGSSSKPKEMIYDNKTKVREWTKSSLLTSGHCPAAAASPAAVRLKIGLGPNRPIFDCYSARRHPSPPRASCRRAACLAQWPDPSPPPHRNRPGLPGHRVRWHWYLESPNNRHFSIETQQLPGATPHSVCRFVNRNVEKRRHFLQFSAPRTISVNASALL